jgi:hypothetical protein
MEMIPPRYPIEEKSNDPPVMFEDMYFMSVIMHGMRERRPESEREREGERERGRGRERGGEHGVELKMVSSKHFFLEFQRMGRCQMIILRDDFVYNARLSPIPLDITNLGVCILLDILSILDRLVLFPQAQTLQKG